MDRRRMPIPEDDEEHRACTDVANEFTHVLCVGAGEDVRPYFQYTLGLTYHVEHPELIIYHHEHQEGARILNHARDLIRAGARFHHGSISDDILVGRSVTFRRVLLEHYPEHVGWCRWFYHGDDFDMLQIVWPDAHGFYPDHPECNQQVVKRQPLLWMPHDVG